MSRFEPKTIKEIFGVDKIRLAGGIRAQNTSLWLEGDANTGNVSVFDDEIIMVSDPKRKYKTIGLLTNNHNYMDVTFKPIITPYEFDSTFEPIKGFIQSLSQRYSLSKWDRIFKDETGWKTDIQTAHIPSYNGETITGEYISSTGELLTGAEVYYKVPSVITPLPQEDADILDRIATYYPNTVVQTDGGIITLKYVADLLNYIDGRYAKSTEHTDAQVMSLRADTDDKIADVQALALER